MRCTRSDHDDQIVCAEAMQLARRRGQRRMWTSPLSAAISKQRGCCVSVESMRVAERIPRWHKFTQSSGVSGGGQWEQRMRREASDGSGNEGQEDR